MTKCSTDPRAPHGFDRQASHNKDAYVCECESWVSLPPDGGELVITYTGRGSALMIRQTINFESIEEMKAPIRALLGGMGFHTQNIDDLLGEGQ